MLTGIKTENLNYEEALNAMNKQRLDDYIRTAIGPFVR
jgi:hypothetical protein